MEKGTDRWGQLPWQYHKADKCQPDDASSDSRPCCPQTESIPLLEHKQSPRSNKLILILMFIPCVQLLTDMEYAFITTTWKKFAVSAVQLMDFRDSDSLLVLWYQREMDSSLHLEFIMGLSEAQWGTPVTKYSKASWEVWGLTNWFCLPGRHVMLACQMATTVAWYRNPHYHLD